MKKNINDLFIAPTTTIKNAMMQLGVTAEKVLFVVDRHDALVGTLTDGDIRRWILAGKDLSVTVDQACNTRPVTVPESYQTESVKAMMIAKKINCIPVLNEDRKIVDLLFWTALFGDHSDSFIRQPLNMPVIVMAGGKGTRLDPFTKILPKPLIPIGDKTILEIIIDRFLQYNVSDFYLTVNHKSKIIKSYFEELNAPYTIHFVEEEKPLGTGGSLRYVKETISGPFFLTNCDILIDTDYHSIKEFHHGKKNDITLVASMKHYHLPYGVCNIESGGELIDISEKPEYNFLVNTGMYIVNPDVLRFIPEGEVFHMTDLIAAVKKAKGRVGVFPIGESSWIDIGEWSEYKKALDKLKL